MIRNVFAFVGAWFTLSLIAAIAWAAALRGPRNDH